MMSLFFQLRQAIFLLLFFVCISSSHAQQPDFNYLTIIDFYNGYHDNVIDTSGNVLFDEEWSYIFRLPECKKFFGIRMLPNAPEGHLPAFDMVPAEFAILSPDGSKKILNYKKISNFPWGPPFTVLTDEGWGLIDCDNNWLIEPACKHEPVVRENYILLMESLYDSMLNDYIPNWKKQGIGDFNGNVLVPPQYTDIYSLYWWKEPHYVLTKNDSSSLIDSRGNMLIPMGDYKIYPSVTDESVWVINDKDENIYYPHTDKWITENTKELRKGLYGQSGKDGFARIDADHESIRQSFLHPFRRIEKNGKYGVISKYGDTILSCIYDNIYEEFNMDSREHNIRQCVFEGMISVELDGAWGLIDTNGRYHTHLTYDELRGVSEGMVAAKVDGKTGFIDIKGNTVIPFVFDWTDKPWKNGIGWANLAEIQVLVNRQGKIIASEVKEAAPSSVMDIKNQETIPHHEYWLLNLSDENGQLYTDETYLELNNMGLTYIPDEVWLFTKLEELELSDNYIKQIPPVTRNNKLKILYLNNNILTKLPEDMSGLKSMHTIDLSNNQLESVPESLLKLKKLRYLLLKGNPVPQEELDRISELRPDLELYEK